MKIKLEKQLQFTIDTKIATMDFLLLFQSKYYEFSKFPKNPFETFKLDFIINVKSHRRI